MYTHFFKRFFDLALSLIGLVAISPVFLVLCVLIRLRLGRPVFFTQVRIGMNEKPFKMIKFRTMTDECDSDGNLLPDTERFTPFGNFLRNTSLDELPELINVFKGDMSLVGPRPLYPKYLPYYTEQEALRHTVRGGITGLAQINGRALCRWDERFAYDVQYVKTCSLIGDIKILWRTIFKVVNSADIGIPSVTDEGGLHIVRKVQRPDKVAVVEEINKKYRLSND